MTLTSDADLYRRERYHSSGGGAAGSQGQLRSRRRNPFLATLLQCLPLVVPVALCSLRCPSLVVIASFALWGSGYLYLQQWRRFLVVFVAGPVFIVLALLVTLWLGFAILGGNNLAALYVPLIGAPSALALGVAVTALDAWRRATAQNRQVG